MKNDQNNYVEPSKSSTNNAKKKRLNDVIGILGPISVEIEEQLKGKTYQQIREEGITKYFQEKYEKANPIENQMDNKDK
ncbi:hypothetical protein AMS62_16755 [Bacillus sp. FJAT-18019]|nr:hypothetical protein AMS62_16755 [Bacillus sp. FJAT-18019]